MPASHLYQVAVLPSQFIFALLTTLHNVRDVAFGIIFESGGAVIHLVLDAGHEAVLAKRGSLLQLRAVHRIDIRAFGTGHVVVVEEGAFAFRVIIFGNPHQKAVLIEKVVIAHRLNQLVTKDPGHGRFAGGKGLVGLLRLFGSVCDNVRAQVIPTFFAVAVFFIDLVDNGGVAGEGDGGVVFIAPSLLPGVVESAGRLVAPAPTGHFEGTIVISHEIGTRFGEEYLLSRFWAFVRKFGLFFRFAGLQVGGDIVSPFETPGAAEGVGHAAVGHRLFFLHGDRGRTVAVRIDGDAAHLSVRAGSEGDGTEVLQLVAPIAQAGEGAVDEVTVLRGAGLCRAIGQETVARASGLQGCLCGKGITAAAKGDDVVAAGAQLDAFVGRAGSGYIILATDGLIGRRAQVRDGGVVVVVAACNEADGHRAQAQ